MIKQENVELLFDSKYLKLMDLCPDIRYYNATRRAKEDLVAIKSDEDFQSMTADAASCIVILNVPDEEPKLLLSYEYRYPAGRFLLSVPAGLMDEEDKNKETPVIATAIREIKEETGLKVNEQDKVFVVNPFLFSTPGMTDESNALVCAILYVDDLSNLSQSGAVGTEVFNGFKLLTRDEAMGVLQNGRDEHGNFYSIQTWAALMYFVSGMYEREIAERKSM